MSSSDSRAVVEAGQLVESRPLLPRWFVDDSRRPLAIGAGLILVFLVIPPIWILVQQSIVHTSADGSITGFTLDHYARLLHDPRVLVSLWNTLVFALGSTVISLVLGGVLAWLVERTNAPFKRLAYATTIISMGTPYILYVIAWLFLLGRAGPINDIYRHATGSFGVLINVNSLWGMILIEGFLWSPLAFLLLASTFRASNADMEEAARMSGASVFDTLWRISMRLAMPAILALALFIFIRAVEAFDVPALIGTPGRINVLTTEIYYSTKLVPPDLGHASSFSVILLVIVAILFYFYGRISKHAERYHSVTGKGYRPRLFDLGGGRWLAGAFVLFNFVIVLVLPITALLWRSLLPFMQGFRAAALQTITIENYAKVFDSPYYLDYAVNTIMVGAGAATAIMLLTTVTGWIAARRGPGAVMLDQLATVPLIFPGIALGVAVMQIYLRVPLPIYGTLWILLIAYVIRYMPYGMRYVYAGVLQIHKELEESAGVAGAASITALRRIVVPLLSPALVSGWLFIFLLATKELSIAILLSSPDSQVMAVAMFDLWVNGQGGELAAFGLVWATIMVLVATGFFVWARRQGQDVFGS
jgi:iron(III) transport system permease protein